MFRITFTTVGLPYFNASVKKAVPTAEPANPEKIKKPHVRVRTLGISSSREIRIGRNMIRMKTCSQKTITFASNNSFSGIRHALSVPRAQHQGQPTTARKLHCVFCDFASNSVYVLALSLYHRHRASNFELESRRC